MIMNRLREGNRFNTNNGTSQNCSRFIHKPTIIMLCINLTIIVIVVSAITFIQSKPLTDKENDSLQLVQILFRHGDRTNIKLALYPKDIHINETYHPYGLEQLTNKGKTRMYRLGKFLRQRYDKYLGKLYLPGVLKAYSSHLPRTKSSLQLVLTGLFPPVDELIWELNFNWQPIPYDAFTKDTNYLFMALNCDSFNDLYWQYMKTPERIEYYKKNKEIFNYVAEHTGQNVTTPSNLFLVYGGLTVEKEWGLKLPDWSKKVYPLPMRDIAIEAFKVFTGTKELRQYSAGYLLKEMYNQIQNKIQNSATEKIILFSGHELNIAHILLTLDLIDDPLPPYGSYMLIELHKIQGVYGLKFFYHDYSQREPQLLKLKNGENYCTLDEFYEWIVDYFPPEINCKMIPYNF